MPDDEVCEHCSRPVQAGTLHQPTNDNRCLITTPEQERRSKAMENSPPTIGRPTMKASGEGADE